ncbi:FGGY-family carbohydrate kinase [Flavihumibacter profundi]|jgi:sugar (pentulose or hexulose) kinase|uniref:FGGY-family carbohydrate kinase n=1 Tax=Flavihumibacter profundi TaxID=2716883 RepID=UPI001CC496E6|nr:FGGY family carbohydrate kinase [Flavihumibacter profundi]MBZ5858773.1 carbohydrate kinase [Flavihumibacter profundi]
MHKKPVIAIFDIGKTNKKFFLFDEYYQVVHEQSKKFKEITDEDGFPCDELKGIERFVIDSVDEILKMDQYDLKAVNFSAYGASLVYIDEKGSPLTPLYNYLKPYPEALQSAFYRKYGGEEFFSMTTASPVLGSLNSGMQLFRMKYEKEAVFGAMKYALHLPQYLSFLVTERPVSDITSIGCHTNLWDFSKGQYHYWLNTEHIGDKLAPVVPADTAFDITRAGRKLKVGIGLHDSSAALIPYLVNFSEPFALLSTGTWCITLNPFNEHALTLEELKADCLCYMSYSGKPVKASRLFAGNEHEIQLGRIAEKFLVDPALVSAMKYDPLVEASLKSRQDFKVIQKDSKVSLKTSVFSLRDLGKFTTYTEAYHQLMIDLVELQVKSAELVIQDTSVRKLFVDGGFSQNDIFMKLLANAMPEVKLFAASLSQATALGAAMAIHKDWNAHAVPANLVQLQYFPKGQGRTA